MQNLLAAAATGRTTGKPDPPSHVSCGEQNSRGRLGGCGKTRRQSGRLKARGIVVPANGQRRIVANIYDIAPGGVSFLYTSEIDRTDSELKMDILIYENQSDFEYFISEVKGRVASATIVTDLKSNKPMWRYGIEFLDMDCTTKNLLLTFCGGRGKPLISQEIE